LSVDFKAQLLRRSLRGRHLGVDRELGRTAAGEHERRLPSHPSVGVDAGRDHVRTRQRCGQRQRRGRRRHRFDGDRVKARRGHSLVGWLELPVAREAKLDAPALAGRRYEDAEVERSSRKGSRIDLAAVDEDHELLARDRHDLAADGEHPGAPAGECERRVA
jgi:hypothetical protein